MTEPSDSQSVNSVTPRKDMGLAFVLTYLFGPLGLFYVSAPAALLLIIVSVLLAVISPILGLIVASIAPIVWAVASVLHKNNSITNVAAAD